MEDFYLLYPQCTKNSIERVFREIFVKEKRQNDLRPCYYASAAVLEELGLLESEELVEAAK